MVVEITRESVCLGDDIEAPHQLTLVLPDGSTLGDLLKCIRQIGFLPEVSGRAVWILEGDGPLALLAQEWPNVEYLLVPDTSDFDCSNLRFRYEAQADPDEALEMQRERRRRLDSNSVP